MFKDVLQSMDLRWISNIGLVLFVAIFAAICIWALTRKRSDVERWNNLPLDETPTAGTLHSSRRRDHRSIES